MSNLSSKFAVCGVFAVALLGFAQNVSFSKGDTTVAENASTLSLSTDTAAMGFADGSAKSVEVDADSKLVASDDDATGQYYSTPCTVCRKRYYSQGTYYYMNYPAYVQCIEEPCS